MHIMQLMTIEPRHTCELLCILGGHSTEMPQIALVSNQHDDDVAVCVIPKLFQPPRDVLECLVLADVVDEQSSNGAAVVGRGDGSVALLAGRVPDLRLDRLCVDLDAAGCEFDADGGLGVQVELIAGESREKVGLADARVSDQHHCRMLARCGTIVRTCASW